VNIRIRHLILFVLCLGYFIAYIDRVNIAVAGPTLRKELGLTPTELGLVFAAFAYPYAAMQILGGWASDRFGPRIVLAVLSLLWATATIAFLKPRRVASRRNCAARYVLVLLAACAASTSALTAGSRKFACGSIGSNVLVSNTCIR
jgi:sugar phosphate permease